MIWNLSMKLRNSGFYDKIDDFKNKNHVHLVKKIPENPVTRVYAFRQSVTKSKSEKTRQTDSLNDQIFQNIIFF